MKKILFLLIVVSFINSIFSQTPPSVKPIIRTFNETSNDYTDDIDPITPMIFGCGVTSVDVKAFYTDTGGTDSYLVEEIPYSSKGYLPEKTGGGYYTPTEMGLTGAMINPPIDDTWVQPATSLSALDFDFCYFGESRDKFQVSSNSIVSFKADPNSSGVEYPYGPGTSDWDLSGMGKIADATLGDNLDAIIQMQDINPADGTALPDTYQFWAIVGNPGERYFVLGVHHMPMYSCHNNVGYATNQMTFYETTNIIEFHIQDKPYCKGWIDGRQAFGIQNKDQTIGIPVASPTIGLDNGSAPVQILDLNDGFYDSNYEPSVDVTPPKSFRFTPNGAGIHPEFHWYLIWTGDPATSTLAPVDDPTNPILTIKSEDIPVTYDANGDPILPATQTFTAVTKYVDQCDPTKIVYGTSLVKVELENPLQMHLQEQDAEDNNTIDTELIETETVFVCSEEDYTLKAIVKEANQTRPYTVDWTVEYGFPAVTVSLQTDVVNTDPSEPYDVVEYVVDHTLITLTDVPYTFTCTITDDGGTPADTSDDCIFSDVVIIKKLKDAKFEYSAANKVEDDKYIFCQGDSPLPENVEPVSTDPVDDNEFYYTIDNGGVWETPLTGTDPITGDTYIYSLDGIPDLENSMDTELDLTDPDDTIPGNINGTGDFIITYHAGCEDNIKEVAIKIISPVATPPEHHVSDPSEAEDIALILCETNTTAHTAEFDTTNWNTTILGSNQTGFMSDGITPLYHVVYTAFTIDSSTGTEIEIPYTLPSNFPLDVNGDPIAILRTLRIYAQVIYNDGIIQCESELKPFEIESNPSPLIEVPYTYSDETDPNDLINIIEMCEDDTDTDPNVHTAKFDTTNWNTIILAGQSGTVIDPDTGATIPRYGVEYAAVDLDGNEVTLPDPFPNPTTDEFISSSIIITATVTDETLPCDISKEFKLSVINNPVNNQLPGMTQCEDDSDPDSNVHTSTFSTTDWTNTVLGLLDTDPYPDGIVVEYSYKLEDGTNVTKVDTGDAATTTLDTSINSSSQTVTVVVKNVGYGMVCETPNAIDTDVREFNLVVINTPTYVIQQDISKCEDVNTDPNIHQHGFDTTGWDASILGVQVDPKFSVVYTAFTIDSVTGAEVAYSLPDPFPDVLDVPSITIRYVVRYTIDEDDGIYCDSQTPGSNPNQNTFKLIVRLIPDVELLVDDMDTTKLVDLKGCENDTDPDPDVHTADFDTTNWYRAILPDNYDENATPSIINPDYIIEYTYVDTDGNTQVVESTNLPTTLALSPQIVTYRAFNRTTGEDTCYSEVLEFEVVVGLLPVGTNTDVVVCSGSTNYITLDDPTTTPPTYKAFTFDDFATFTNVDNNGNRNTYQWKAKTDNPKVIGESLSYVDNKDFDSPGITDILINVDPLETTQEVVYEVIPISEYGCVGLPFEVKVKVYFAPNMTDQAATICNDEEVDFDLDLYSILAGNTYTWFAKDNRNVSGISTTEQTGHIINDTIINISGEEQIIEYVVTPTSVAGCEGDSFSVFVTVNPRPDFELKPQYFICPEDGFVMIGETTNSDDYIYYWFEANDINVSIWEGLGSVDNGKYKTYEVRERDLVTSNGNYVLTVEDKFTHCIYSQFTTVSMAEQMAIASIHVSDFNAPDNTITIAMVGGTGAYEYTLHYTDSNGISQTITQNSPIFEHLDANTYQIEVTDLNNCSINIFSNDVYVLDAPSFFTPNGDGENETWTITGANIIPNSKIYIFDRYGKVLAQLDPTSVLGWDGTYKGMLVSDSDYWFKAEYIDPNTGESKVVKGHFSLVIE